MSKVKVKETLSELKAKLTAIQLAKVFNEPYSEQELKETQAKIDYFEYGINVKV